MQMEGDYYNMGTWDKQFNSINYRWIHELRDSMGYIHRTSLLNQKRKKVKKNTHQNPGLSQLSCCIYATFSCPLVTQLYHLKICIIVYWLIFSCLCISRSPVVEREGFIARILHYRAFSGTAIWEFHPPSKLHTPPLSKWLYSMTWG